jgi:DNA-binding MarR family transcriptional regulator/GNAT superfamily N-acetyltransferase
VRTAEQDRIARFRTFNRFYTQLIGVLDDGYLRTPWSVTEARVIFELATRDGTAEVAGLRRDLDLDSGYLSRMLTHLEREGVVRRHRSETDGRRQLVTLTARGRKEFARLDRRSSKGIERLLGSHSELAQRRVVEAMDTIRRVMDTTSRARPSVQLRPPAPGEYGWVVERHGAIYASEYGWDQTFEALVARVVADYLDDRDPRRDSAWIAELDGDAVGCVFCVGRNATTAQLRLLLVEPHARGLGVGAMLVERCIGFAREAGYDRLVLWTNDVLVDARHVYERAGFELVHEERHTSFGAELVGQDWVLELRGR